MVTPALKEILACAYPCPAITGRCQHVVRYDPQCGLIPRGYAGATASKSDVRLVLCLAEPGEPSKGEWYDVSTPPSVLIDQIASLVAGAYRSGASPFHRNVRFILDACWPGLSFDVQLQRTWVTEGVLCSANVTTGPVAPVVEQECASRHLKRQLEFLSNAFVIALGKKAERRLHLAGRPPDFVARAAGRPIGSRVGAEASWRSAGEAFQLFQSQKEPNRAPEPNP
jgi:hypothetical protein